MNFDVTEFDYLVDKKGPDMCLNPGPNRNKSCTISYTCMFHYESF